MLLLLLLLILLLLLFLLLLLISLLLILVILVIVLVFLLILLLILLSLLVVAIFWARVLCRLVVEEARFRMRVNLRVIFIRSLVYTKHIPGRLRSGSGVALD